MTHPEGTFVTFIGDKLLYLGKTDSKAKNQIPLLLYLEDGKIQWKDKKFKEEEINFLRNENFYLQDIAIEGFPVLFAANPKLKQGSSRFLILTESGECRFYEPKDFGFEPVGWKVPFQCVKGAGKNASSVVALTTELNGSITDVVLLTSMRLVN